MNEEKHSLRKCGLCFDTGIICRRNGQCLGCCKYAKKRKKGKDGDLETEDDEWGETGDPYATPIGDAVVPLMLLAMAYMAVRIMRKRKGALSK